MIVTVHDLWKRYGRFDALQGLEFGLPDGSAFALVGPNGAGKTTTIKILVNLLEPSRGNAAILGLDSRSLSPRELADIGYVSENVAVSANGSDTVAAVTCSSLSSALPRSFRQRARRTRRSSRGAHTGMTNRVGFTTLLAPKRDLRSARCRALY